MSKVKSGPRQDPRMDGMRLKTERNAVRIEKLPFLEAKLKYPAYSCLTCRNRRSNVIVKVGEVVAAVVVIVVTILLGKKKE
jgi:hypothetical protein